MEFLLWLSVLFATATSAVFLWGLWKLLTHPKVQKKIKAVVSYFTLTREGSNPILKLGLYEWENVGVLNPAAVDIGGRVHLFYRAIGADGVSRIGYSSSSDGIHFDERLPYPVYMLDAESTDDTKRRRDVLAKSPGLVASGGSWIGIEDPRAIVLDNRIYLSFSAFLGWDSLRIGVVSITVDDLVAKRWKWSRPIFLTEPKQVHKNWVLFPEKIDGKIAILHGFGDGARDTALIEYVDSIDQEPAVYIQSDPKHRNDFQELEWDSRVRGAGPPPVKTPYGWLVLYHANDAREMHRYKLGALLLDLSDPTRIIARSNEPILAPDEYYENDGKPGIVYACGAVVRDGILRVYYGGGDKVVCTASAPLEEFVQNLMKNEPLKLTSSMVQM